MLALVIGALAGCAGGGNASSAASSALESGSGAASAAGAGEAFTYQLPLVEEPVTLEYFCEIDEGKVGVHHKDYNGLLQFQLFEQNTGVHIEFIHPPSGQSTEQFNLILASNNRPDMMFYGNWNNIAGGTQKLLDDGLFYDLKPMMDTYAPDLTAFLEEHTEVKKWISTDQGAYYCFPYLRYQQEVANTDGFQGRRDWLDKLGVAQPQTIAEWDAFFEAVMRTDLDGDGNPANEIPLICMDPTKDNTLYTFAGAWGFHPHLYVKDGKAQYGALQPEYKEYVKKMAEWFQKGYLSPDFNSLDYKQKQARIMNGEAASWYDGLGMGFDTYAMSLGGDPGILFVTNYPTLEGHSDAPVYFFGTLDFSGAGTGISTTTKYPELCAQWLNYWYTPEGSDIVNFGQEGVTYQWVDGFPQLTDEIAHNPDSSVSVALGKYCLGASWGPFVHDSRVRQQRLLRWDEQVEAARMWAKADISGMMPFVSYSEEESSQAANYQNEIKTYVDEMTLKFILGQADIDQEYDKMLSVLKNDMDIEGYLSLVSAAVGRYESR